MTGIGTRVSSHKSFGSKREHVDALLDEGLNETFPASDPVAVSITDGSVTGTSTAAEPAVVARHGCDAGENNVNGGKAMRSRLDYSKSSPQGVAVLRHLNSYVEGCGLEHSLLELVKIRASQINGCAYCLDMHTKDACAAGENEQRLYTLSAWRETPFFTARERAALAWTEAVTCISQEQVEDGLYDAMKTHFSEKEIVDLTLAIITINGWNRLAISFRTPPGSYKPNAAADWEAAASGMSGA